MPQMNDYRISDTAGTETIRATSIAAAVEEFTRGYSDAVKNHQLPNREEEAAWTIWVRDTNDKLLAEYEVREDGKGNVTASEVATQPDAGETVHTGRVVCEANVWGRTHTLEANSNDPTSSVVVDGEATGYSVEEYHAVFGGTAGVTLAEAMMYQHLSKIGAAQFPTQVTLSEPGQDNRKITVAELTGEPFRELQSALAGMRVRPASAPSIEANDTEAAEDTVAAPERAARRGRGR